MTYRVSGDPGLDLSQFAQAVDTVLSEQAGGFTRYAATGNSG